MTSKVPWNRQEAVILLDGYIDVIKGELPRLRIIRRVSGDLRKMAVNNGMEIDDIFRNENGISFQMQSMESAFCGRTVTKPGTVLFKEVVAIYNENREEYEKLLREAKSMIGSNQATVNEYSSETKEPGIKPVTEIVSVANTHSRGDSILQQQHPKIALEHAECESFTKLGETLKTKLLYVFNLDNKEYKECHEYRRLCYHDSSIYQKSVESACEAKSIINTLKEKDGYVVVDEKNSNLVWKCIQTINECMMYCTSWQRSACVHLAYRFLENFRWFGKEVEFTTFNEWGHLIFETNINQLSYYLWWRENARKGVFHRATGEYLWIYINDIVLNTCYRTASESLSALIKLHEKYTDLSKDVAHKRESKRSLGFYITSYARYNGLTDNIEFLTDKFGFDDDFSTCLDIENGVFNGHESYLMNLISSSIRTTTFMSSPERQLVVSIIALVFQKVCEICKSKGINITHNLVGELKSHVCWNPYDSSLLAMDTISQIPTEIPHSSFSFRGNTYHYTTTRDQSLDPKQPCRIFSFYHNDTGEMFDRKGFFYRSEYTGHDAVGVAMVDYIVRQIQNAYRSYQASKKPLKEKQCPFKSIKSEIDFCVVDIVEKCIFKQKNDLNVVLTKTPRNIPSIEQIVKDALIESKTKDKSIVLVRTEQDRRLIAKYPLVYKRIFIVLSDNKEVGISIADLHKRISHIARCADIEDILDNVSWSKCEDKLYRFSEEISHNGEPIEVSVASPGLDVEKTIAKLNIVDFNNVGDYSYTKPISISYFDVKVADLTSWTDAYVKLVTSLYDDHPSTIPVGESFTGTGRIDFGNKEIAKTMTAPKPVYMQMYLETNLSATNIVGKLKALLDICRVDYENVVIEYQKKTDIVATPRVITAKNNFAYSVRIDSNSFTAFLREYEGIADGTCRSYVSAISTAERFAKEHSLDHTKLFTPDWREAKATMDALFSNAIFIEYNSQQHNRFRAAMKKLLVFIKTDSTSVSNSINTEVADQPIVDEKILSVLTENFRKGFRLGSPIELRKFKRCYEQLHNVALEGDDASIERKISSCGILFDDKIFVPQTMLGDETRERLFSYIRKSFAEGKTALYYQALFNEFSEEFLDYFIYNADMLKEYLSYTLKGEFFFDRSYLSKEADTASDPIEEIRTCLKEYAAPMTYDVMFENLPHIPQQKIKQILTTNAEFVNNGRGEYFHVSAVHYSDEELDNIAVIITDAIESKEFLSGNELIDAIKSKYPYIYEKNSAFSMVGLRDAIKYHLCRRFSFSGNIISKSGNSLTMSDVFADYCRSRDAFTIDELNVLASELGTVIYFDSVYENSLRVSSSRFVSKSQANFLVPDTDAALDLFCTGEYIPIRKINGYSIFPNAGFPWNEYLLEHYVAMYSNKYTLFHIGFNANKCVGVIAKKSAMFENFDDCITSILADSNILLKKEPALQYLYDEGYIARRIYTNIEELLIRATAKRNRKEAN